MRHNLRNYNVMLYTLAYTFMYLTYQKVRKFPREMPIEILSTCFLWHNTQALLRTHLQGRCAVLWRLPEPHPVRGKRGWPQRWRDPLESYEWLSQGLWVKVVKKRIQQCNCEEWLHFIDNLKSSLTSEYAHAMQSFGILDNDLCDLSELCWTLGFKILL